jgi:hypothetical protein
MTDLWSFNSTDSVYISESLSLNRQIPVSKNKQDTSFSFVLDSGRNVLVQGRAGVLDLSENIIIDDVDTLRLKNINRFLKEKRATGHKRWWGRDFIIKAEE